MDKAAEVSQPRVIAQTKDFHENEYRLVWRPPTPADHPDGDGEPTQGHLIIEQRGEDALGEPAWRGSRVDPLAECDHGGLYALIVKLHTAYETAWDQRESIAAHSHDLFQTLIRDEDRFRDLMRKIETLTDRVAGRAAASTPATPSYDDAADASVETVAARARRLTDRFLEQRYRSGLAGTGEAVFLYELTYAELQDCEQMERLRQKAPRDTAVGYPDAARPHIVNGEFQSDKYPTTPRGKVPLSVKDADAQDLLWVYAQRRRAVDAQFSDDLEFALDGAGYKFRGVYSDEPSNDASDLRSRLSYAGSWVRGAAAEVTRPDTRGQLIAAANEIQKAIAHPFLVDPKPSPIVAVPDSFPTIDIEAVGCAASDIQSAYGSLAFAPPEGYRIHIVRMCDAIQELANALGLKPPSELSPPVAIMIAAARAFVHGGSFDDDDIEATDLVAAVKAYEAQT